MVSKDKKYYFLPNENKVGERIKKIREESGLKVGEFVDKIEVSPMSFYKWQSGKCFPDIESLKEICKLSKTPITIDELLIPDAYLKFDYEGLPQTLRLDFKYDINENGEKEITNIKDVLKDIDSYKKHCEIVNYLNQREVFSFNDNNSYFYKDDYSMIIKKIEERFGTSYRFNIKDRNDIYSFFERERIRFYLNGYFNKKMEKSLINLVSYRKMNNYISDNSISDAILLYSRLLECNDLEYQVKVFELLDDYLKIIAFEALIFTRDSYFEPLISYLNKDDKYNMLGELFKATFLRDDIIASIDEKTKDMKQDNLGIIKDIHEMLDYGYKEELLKKEWIFYQYIILFSGSVLEEKEVKNELL